MREWKKEFDSFLLSTDSFQDVVILLKANNTSLRSYLNKYSKEPSKVIYHMPLSWNNDPQYWRTLDRKWWEYCQENELE